MGTYSPEAFGSFNRTTGYAATSKRKKTEQNEYSARLELVASFLNGISRFIAIGYRLPKSAVKQTALTSYFTVNV